MNDTNDGIRNSLKLTNDFINKTKTREEKFTAEKVELKRERKRRASKSSARERREASIRINITITIPTPDK